MFPEDACQRFAPSGQSQGFPQPNEESGASKERIGSPLLGEEYPPAYLKSKAHSVDFGPGCTGYERMPSVLKRTPKAVVHLHKKTNGRKSGIDPAYSTFQAIFEVKKARTVRSRLFVFTNASAGRTETSYCHYGIVRVTVVVCLTPPPLPVTVIV